MKKPIILLGGGGHAKVLIDSILSGTEYVIEAIIDIDPNLRRLYDIPVKGQDYLKESRCRRLAVAIGTIKASQKRKRLFELYKRAGFSFPVIKHRSATVARDVVFGEGTQVMANVTVNPGARTGENVILNTASVIEHDCIIGAHTHIAPRALLCGSVETGTCCHIGAGALLLQGIRIGDHATVGAGSVVTATVAKGSTVVGCPARRTDG